MLDKIKQFLQKQFSDFIRNQSSFNGKNNHLIEVKKHESQRVTQIDGLDDVEDVDFYAGETYIITVWGEFRVIEKWGENTWRSQDYSFLNTKTQVRYNREIKNFEIIGWGDSHIS